jgi:gas vesicle protein
MNHHKHHHDNTGGNIVSFIAGAAMATLAAGYFLYGPHGKQHRRQVEAWVKDATEEITERFQSAKEMTEEVYEKIVDEVMEKYALLKEVGEEKAEEVGADLKDRFDEISSNVKRLKKDFDKEMKKD